MTAPERIWAMRYYGKGDEGFWDTTHSPRIKEGAQHEYILHTRAALAASPVVQEIVAHDERLRSMRIVYQRMEIIAASDVSDSVKITLMDILLKIIKDIGNDVSMP